MVKPNDWLHLISPLHLKIRYCSHDVRPATHLTILNRLWRWGEMHSSQNMHPPCQSAKWLTREWTITKTLSFSWLSYCKYKKWTIQASSTRSLKISSVYLQFLLPLVQIFSPRLNLHSQYIRSNNTLQRLT